MNLIEFLSFLIIFLTFTFLGLFLFKIVSSQFMLEERFFYDRLSSKNYFSFLLFLFLLFLKFMKIKL